MPVAAITLAPTSVLLWSTNNAIKHRVARDYIGTHRVWCSQAFEGAAIGRYSHGAASAASSDPAQIYRQLHKDVTTNDRHSDAIKRQREGLLGLALKLKVDGVINATAAAEISTIATRAEVSDWRPLVYVIPTALVIARVERVPPDQWAGLEAEFIIPDLRDDEFHVMEPMPCR